jgi:hypothetical protein
MNALQKIQAAQTAAQAIIAGFKNTADATPDATLARTEALMAEIADLKNGDKIALLVAKIVALEAPKNDNKIKVEDVARSLMESPECAVLTWGDVADLICTNGFGEKTSQASISSYASKKKGDWNIAPREKLRFNAADLLAAVNG